MAQCGMILFHHITTHFMVGATPHMKVMVIGALCTDRGGIEVIIGMEDIGIPLTTDIIKVMFHS